MSWSNVALSSLVNIKGGGTPSKAKSEYWNGSIPWVSVKDFKSTDLNGASDYITQEGIDNSATSLIPCGNLIVPTRMALGKVAVNSVDIAINQDLKALIIKDESMVDIEYLFRCIQSKSEEIIRQGKGATVKGITVDVLKNLQIPLPPLETQKQIAAVLEKADQLRKDCQQMERELNGLAQSVFIDMFGDPVTNPKGWETESLDTIAKVQIGPFGSQLHKEDYIADGIPLINPTHIVKGQIVPDMNLTLTPEKFETLPNYHLETGDIIMGRRGEMGRTALIDEYSQGWFCGTGSLYIRITSQLVQPAFLNSVMSCSSMKTWLEEQSLGATMPNLNKKILHSIQVPIPTTAVQKNYALALDVLCKQRQEQKEHIKELDGLFNALMQKAFKGELDL
ncbi:restriction endonuclease subunit S [Vibrio sp. FF145]|uniref:restriction endonuclease subunit S n=1 Tax=Vibrio sp. FF145 TaxID=3230013 RepID=UPI00352F8BE3